MIVAVVEAVYGHQVTPRVVPAYVRSPCSRIQDRTLRVCLARTISRLTGSVELDALGRGVASVVRKLRATPLVLGQKPTTGRPGRVGLSTRADRGPLMACWRTWVSMSLAQLDKVVWAPTSTAPERS